ncbi:UNC-50-like protein [Pluteus cervinus]|uniref:UNC-50-like protein n=1 Tax=Pluteus cervinus TaxID=181527 RepID=A0ACD3AXV4_9AGAR|nr:UNC-50-like protein [Pluteus cervinus]
MVLPIRTSYNPEEGGVPSRQAVPFLQRIPVIFRRLHRFHQMDFELALWQLTYLCIAPRRVYKHVYFHKQTKNTWARDDPAILVLLAGCLTVSAMVWSIVYHFGLSKFIEVAFMMILRDFFLSGILISTLIWFIANRVLVSPPSHTSPTDTSIEWAYVFDVHTNAFFPFYLTLYLAQLFLLSLILRDNWVCLWLGNTLYFLAFAQYTYGIYVGLNALPFLIRSELFLAPLLPIFVAYIVSLLGFNVAKHALRLYFGSI